MSVSVCLSVQEHISRTTHLNFSEFSMYVACGCVGFLLWWRCNALCTSGFVDDVIFSHHGAGDAIERKSRATHHGAAPDRG